MSNSAETSRRRGTLLFVAVGGVAGLSAGLFGVGGGVVVVPLLVLLARFGQHEAHATSLVAIVPIALVGAVTFAVYDEVRVDIAALLAAGALAGAPLGARIMVRSSDRWLKTGFGVLAVAVGLQLLWT